MLVKNVIEFQKENYLKRQILIDSQSFTAKMMLLSLTLAGAGKLLVAKIGKKLEFSGKDELGKICDFKLLFLKNESFENQFFLMLFDKNGKNIFGEENGLWFADRYTQDTESLAFIIRQENNVAIVGVAAQNVRLLATSDLDSLGMITSAVQKTVIAFDGSEQLKFNAKNLFAIGENKND